MLSLALLETSINIPGVSIVLSAAVALIGLVIYFISEKPKVVEAAKIAFFCGLLAFLLVVR